MVNFNTSEEEWEVIENYDGKYSVSSHGRVYNNWNEVYLISKSSKAPYRRVNLNKGGQVKTNYVHRLVGEAFIPNILNLDTINHIDEDKYNNHVDNLEWMSLADNLNHGTRNEKIGKSNNIRKKIPVIGISLCGYYDVRLESIKDGKEFGFNPQAIGKNANGVTKSSGGYTWEKVVADEQ